MGWDADRSKGSHSFKSSFNTLFSSSLAQRYLERDRTRAGTS